jgi:hypothetical protein
MFLRMETIKPKLEAVDIQLMLAKVWEAVLRTTFFYAFTTCLLALPLAAQISQATLSGTVRDPTGAVIPSAAVEIRNLATNFTRTAKTEPKANT